MEEVFGQVVVLLIRQLGGHGLDGVVLDIGRRGVVAIGEDTLCLAVGEGEESGLGDWDRCRKDEPGGSDGLARGYATGCAGGGGAQTSGDQAAGSRKMRWRHGGRDGCEMELGNANGSVDGRSVEVSYSK